MISEVYAFGNFVSYVIMKVIKKYLRKKFFVTLMR